MDVYIYFLQTLINGLVNQGKPVPELLRARLEQSGPYLLLQHPIGTYRHDLLTSIPFDSAVLSLAIRPACKETNGRDWLAVGLGDRTVRVLDLKTGKLLWRGEGHAYQVESVSWSPEGLLASGGGEGESGEILVWHPDLEAVGEPLWQEVVGEPLWQGEGLTKSVNSVSWFLDGRLASGGGDGEAGEILIWLPDMVANIKKFRWQGFGLTKSVNSVSWFLDGRLASGGGDGEAGEILVWRPEWDDWMGAPIWQAQESRRGEEKLVGYWKLKSVTSVTWHVSGDYLFSGGGDKFGGELLGWSPSETLRESPPSWRGEGHMSPVSCVSRSEWTLASGSAGGGQGHPGEVFVWKQTVFGSLRSSDARYKDYGLPIWRGEGHTGGIHCLCWLKDLLVSGGTDNRVLVSRPNQQATMGITMGRATGHRGEVESVAWSSQGCLASGGSDNLVLVSRPHRRAWKGMKLWQGLAEPTKCVHWSSNGNLASGGGEKGKAGDVLVWSLDFDVGQGLPIWRGKGHMGTVICVAWSPSGRYLASGGDDHRVQVWHPELMSRPNWKATEGTPPWLGEGHADIVRSVDWSPCERYLASGGDDHQVLIWQFDLKSDKLIQLWLGRGHTKAVQIVCWSSNGLLASGGKDRHVLVWRPDLKAGEGPLEWDYVANSCIRSLAWSPNGKWLVVGTLCEVLLLNVMAHKLETCFPAPAEIYALRWFGPNEIWAADDGVGTGIPRVYRFWLNGTGRKMDLE